MEVLVVGGSGFVGSALALELFDRGHTVSVFARTPEDAVRDLPDDVRRISGDVTDSDAVRDAVAAHGHDAVVNLVALSPLFQPRAGNDRHAEVHLGGTENVVRAMADAGVFRLLQMSALGADPDGPTAYIRAKGRAEEVVRESELNWTVVRPSVIFGDGAEFVSFTKLLTTPYVTGLPGGGKTPFQPIWIGDLAPIMADCLDPEHGGETYEFGGPEVLTLADVARRIYRSEGRSTRVVPVPMPLARVGLTLAGPIPFVPMGPDQYRSLRFDNTVRENDVRALGRDQADLRTFDEYLGLDDPADREHEPSLARAGGAVGLIAAAVGLLVAGFFTWVGVLPYLDLVPPGVGFVDGPGLGASNAPVLAFWSAVIALCAVLVGAAARARRALIAWVLATWLLVLTFLGMFSIGPMVAPFALLALLSAALLTGGRLQRGNRNDDEPTGPGEPDSPGDDSGLTGS